MAQARDALNGARAALRECISPARSKTQRQIKKRAANNFSYWAERWLEGYRMAESTRAMRRFTYQRDLEKTIGSLLLSEVTEDLVRQLCQRIVARSAPAVAVHAREIISQVFRYADEHGERHTNPAELVRPSSIATFAPRDRSLSPKEITLFYRYLGHINSAATIKLACRMLLLTLVRKSELTDATWDEVDFESALWTIPGTRMKRRNPHNVYLSRQAMDLFIAFKTCSGGSRFVCPIGTISTGLPPLR